MAEMTNMTVRFERVCAFLEYLHRKEQKDLATSAERAGLFRELLIDQIRRQIEIEIKHISKKVA